MTCTVKQPSPSLMLISHDNVITDFSVFRVKSMKIGNWRTIRDGNGEPFQARKIEIVYDDDRKIEFNTYRTK